jgi:hypothetical protein
MNIHLTCLSYKGLSAIFKEVSWQDWISILFYAQRITHLNLFNKL